MTLKYHSHRPGSWHGMTVPGCRDAQVRDADLVAGKAATGPLLSAAYGYLNTAQYDAKTGPRSGPAGYALRGDFAVGKAASWLVSEVML